MFGQFHDAAVDAARRPDVRRVDVDHRWVFIYVDHDDRDTDARDPRRLPAVLRHHHG